MTDYINRGDSLKHMCLWEYCSKVYKKKFSDEELKKYMKKSDDKKSSRECEQVHPFLSDHPQSETHWQRVRIKGSAMIPTLSKLPPSSNSNKLRYQKCILLLFKPFASFEELYNGTSWDETYSDLLEVTENKHYIENLQELLNCMEQDDDDEENNDEVIGENEENDECDVDPDETDDTGLDSLTTEVLEVIRNTPWLTESVSNHQTQQTMEPLFDTDSRFPRAEIWKAEMKQQNQDKIDNPESDESECEEEPDSTEFTPMQCDTDAQVDFTMAPVNDEHDRDDIERLRESIVNEKTLNVKQQKAFEIATDNVIKRHFKDKTEQLIGYVGGPGGTGKVN